MLTDKENQPTNTKKKIKSLKNPSKEYFEDCLVQSKKKNENLIPIYKK